MEPAFMSINQLEVETQAFSYTDFHTRRRAQATRPGNIDRPLIVATTFVIPGNSGLTLWLPP
jgi:hypothetical protein